MNTGEEERTNTLFRPGGEGGGGEWGHLAEDERLSFLGTFICVVYENRWCGFWIRGKI